MFKRLFWIGVGVTVGALAVIKAQAYVKANTPDAARAFVFGPDQAWSTSSMPPAEPARLSSTNITSTAPRGSESGACPPLSHA